MLDYSIGDFLHNASGTIPGWLTLISVIAVAWYLKRGGAVTALDTMVTANQILEDRVKKLEQIDRAKDKEIATLAARTDIALALSPLVSWTEKYDRQSDERHIAILHILNMIAERLGPEANGHTH